MGLQSASPKRLRKGDADRLHHSSPQVLKPINTTSESLHLRIGTSHNLSLTSHWLGVASFQSNLSFKFNRDRRIQVRHLGLDFVFSSWIVLFHSNRDNRPAQLNVW